MLSHAVQDLDPDNDIEEEYRRSKNDKVWMGVGGSCRLTAVALWPCQWRGRRQGSGVLLGGGEVVSLPVEGKESGSGVLRGAGMS